MYGAVRREYVAAECAVRQDAVCRHQTLIANADVVMMPSGPFADSFFRHQPREAIWNDKTGSDQVVRVPMTALDTIPKAETDDSAVYSASDPDREA